MTAFGIDWSVGALWLAASLVLIIGEMAVPGFFLSFLGVGAAVTGLIALFVPGVPIIAQALLFAAVTAATVAVGRRWYLGSDRSSSDPLLNDRVARMIGKRVEVCDAIVGGTGRVTVGDGAWTATGPDTAVGATVKIVGADGNVLQVEPA